MTQLQELREQIISDRLSSRYLIIQDNTVIHRFNAMNAVAAKEVRDSKFPGCELAISIKEL